MEVEVSRPSENDRRQQMVKSSRTLWNSWELKTFCVPQFLIIGNRHHSTSMMGGAMLTKSLIQFSVGGQGCVPSLLFDLRPNYSGGNEDNGDLLQMVLCTTTLSAPSLAAGHCWPTPPLETPGHSRASLSQSLWGHCSFLLGPGVHRVLFVPSKSLFPESCVSSGSSMVGLMATSSRGLMP